MTRCPAAGDGSAEALVLDPSAMDHAESQRRFAVWFNGFGSRKRRRIVVKYTIGYFCGAKALLPWSLLLPKHAILSYDFTSKPIVDMVVVNRIALFPGASLCFFELLLWEG